MLPAMSLPQPGPTSASRCWTCAGMFSTWACAWDAAHASAAPSSTTCSISIDPSPRGCREFSYTTARRTAQMPKKIFTLALALFPALAAAQDYPAREIRSICNFAAGSGADIVVRYYSDQLAKLAGKPVIVENRPGAQGSVASAYVAKSKPDGYTLMITPASSTLATAPYIFKKLPFDPLRDFAP